MEIKTKYKLGDWVFFIGDGKIHQARICEVRFISRFEKTSNTLTEEVNYTIYRLFREDRINGDFQNHDVKIKYRGEYEAYKWFEESQIYKDEDEALNHIRQSIDYMDDVEIEEPNKEIGIV